MTLENSDATTDQQEHQYLFEDLVDIEALQQLTDDLYKATHIPSAIITTEGRVLTGSGWQRICTDFHRQHPQVELECIKSGTRIHEGIAAGEEFVVYKCPRGLTDACTPVIIGGRHMANVFAGQLFTEPPTEAVKEFFRQSAREFGFDEEQYIAAFSEVPVMPIYHFRAALRFLAHLARLIADLGLTRLRHLQAMERLQLQERHFRAMVENIEDLYITYDRNLRMQYVSPVLEHKLKVNPAGLLGKTHLEAGVQALEAENLDRHLREVLSTGLSQELEFDLALESGDVSLSTQINPLFNDDGAVVGVISLTKDITERKRMESILERKTKLLDSIQAAQTAYIEEGDARVVFDRLLEILVSITDSEFGFIDEVRVDSAGNTYKSSLSLTNISWNPDSQQLYDDLVASDLRFANLENLAGRPAVTRQLVIANDALTDPRAGGQQPGHPVIKSFMGIPMFFGGELVGVAGIANRAAGYDKSIGTFLEPFISACAGIIRDVRSRKNADQANSALRESEQRYRSIVTNALDGICVVGMDGIIRHVNQSYATILGYDISEMIGQNITEFEAIETPAETAQHIQRVIAQGAEKFETRQRTKGSAEVILEVSAFAVPGSKGLISTFIHDITESRSNEKLLKLQNELAPSLLEIDDLDAGLRACLGTAMAISESECGGIYLVDNPAGTFRLVCHAGLSADYVAEVDNLSADSRGAQLVAAGNPLYLETAGFPIDNPARREGLTALAAVPIFHQGAVIACCNLAKRHQAGYDSAQRKALEAIAVIIGGFVSRALAHSALQESELRFQTVADWTADWEMWIGSQGELHYISPSVEQITGYRPAEFLADDTLLQHIVIAEDRDQMVQHLAHNLASHGSSETCELLFRIRTRSGEIKHIQHRCRPVYDNDHQFIGRRVSNRDNTLYVRATRELQENEERFRTIFTHSKEAIALVSEGRHLMANSAYLAMFGFSSLDEISELALVDMFAPAERERMNGFIKARAAGELSQADFSAIGRRSDGSVFPVEMSISEFTSGYRGKVVAILRDVTERKKREWAKDVEAEFLNLLNQPGETKELVKGVVTFLQRVSGCAAVGIRLREGDDYPYYETSGFPERFVQLENSLCSLDSQGALRRDGVGNPVLDCMCGNVIQGRFNPGQSFFTRKGSFWSNNTTRLLASTSEADRQARTRNRCNGEGYESVALIAIRFGKEICGLIQLNDKRPDRLTLDLIQLVEHLADHLGSALVEHQTRDALRTNEARLLALFNDSPISIWVEDFSRVQDRFAELRNAGVTDWREYFESHPEELATFAGLIQIVDCNDTSTRFFGADSKEQLQQSLTSYFNEDSLACFKNELMQLASGKTKFESEVPILLPDGGVQIFFMSLNVVSGYENTLGLVLVSFLNITDRYEAAEEMRRNKEELQSYSQQLRALMARVEEIRERERAGMAREVHDVLGQNLTSIKLDLQSFGRHMQEVAPSSELDSLMERAMSMVTTVDATIATVQRLSSELRPSALDKLGLGPALHAEARRLQERTGIDCDVVYSENLVGIAPEVSTALFRICQECLTNVVRHAQASSVNIALSMDTEILLVIEDDGVGIEDSAVASPLSLGLLGMRERTALLNGQMSIRRGQAGGTVVEISVPVAVESEQT